MASLSINGLYKAAEQARQEEYKSAKAQSQKRLNSALKSIDSEYRSNVTQAQTASRISALGQEEKLAAAGLNFGSAYSSATSGYTESARVAESNNLRSNLNALSTQASQSRSAAQSQYSEEVAQASQNRYAALADIGLQKAQALQNQQQQQYENAMERWKTYGYVLPADAKILGVKAGTKTASKEYDQAKLAIDRLKLYL
ncbi:MAG: hypothetical protein ACI4PM_03675 [Butyricicoccus sp.]